MKRTANGWWEQEHAGESVAAANANGDEYRRRQEADALASCPSCPDKVKAPTRCGRCGRVWLVLKATPVDSWDQVAAMIGQGIAVAPRRRPFGVSIDQKGTAGGCMSCNTYERPVAVFYLGTFQARLCQPCAAILVDELKRATT